MNLQEQKNRIIQIMEVKGLETSTKKLSRSFEFKDFQKSIDFVNKVAKIAEKQNHHPEISIDYDKVNISITDHEKGGVSEKCHKFMDEVNKINSNKSEFKESEITEKCWAGYEQKGMKTMFGKKYPNCVKKSKK